MFKMTIAASLLSLVSLVGTANAQPYELCRDLVEGEMSYLEGRDVQGFSDASAYLEAVENACVALVEAAGLCDSLDSDGECLPANVQADSQ